MDDLVTRLRAALDEIERVARAAIAFDYGVKDWADDGDPVNVHIALHDPERELRMVAAHRKILDLHVPNPLTQDMVSITDGTRVTTCISCGGWYTLKTGTEWPCDTIRALAEAYGIEV